MKRIDEQGEHALVKPRVAVNRFPDFVAELVRQLRATIPSAGKRRMAHVLARAGLVLSASSVARLARRSAPTRPQGPSLKSPRPEATTPVRVVTAKRPHHVWHVDITTLPTGSGFWVPWLPQALAQVWPFSWHVVVVLDHFSRAIVHAGVFLREPSAAQLCRLLDVAAASVGSAPHYVVTDRGTQFRSEYLEWCYRHDITPRFGALGQHGSIAIVERFMRTLKHEGLRRLLIPLSLSRMRAELAAFCLWYNTCRPHHALGGATPAEMRDGNRPANDRAGWEVRPGYPLRDRRRRRRRTRASGALRLVVGSVAGRAHLPTVELRRVA